MYLCSCIFDVGLTEEQVQENVLAGRYRLHWFAASQWITLTKHCVEQSNDLSAYPDLLVQLKLLQLELRNYSFEGQIDLKDVGFQSIQSKWPEISQFINGVLQFRQRKGQVDSNYTNGALIALCIFDQ
jgi:hypothetical protein